MEIVRSAVDGGAAPDFAAWVQPHRETMWRVAQRFSRPGEAEDVLQNALLAAWRHRDRFDPAVGSAAAWLTTLTLNEARKSHRFRGRAAPDLGAADGADPDAGVDVGRALRRLPRRQALAIGLYYYVGLPVAEVARVMGCAEGTVKSTLAAAREALHRILGEDYR